MIVIFRWNCAVPDFAILFCVQCQFSFPGKTKLLIIHVIFCILYRCLYVDTDRVYRLCSQGIWGLSQPAFLLILNICSQYLSSIYICSVYCFFKFIFISRKWLHHVIITFYIYFLTHHIITASSRIYNIFMYLPIYV